MRLLRIEVGGNFSLVERVGNSIPRYAILSHTWGGDNEEFNFNDVTNGTGKEKPGFRKVQFCGEQAAKDELEFFWVDTCCIDKSSSTELQEAINSMFQWYSKASKCYVYLTDVSCDNFTDGEQSFPKSRWFTRGWTLQELLAPKYVEFYSLEQKHIGDKNSMMEEINNIIGISIQALQGHPLHQFSIEERKSWAANRHTKREEDLAYSLLGIFDIHMSLLYGEGRKNAFARLERKIRKSENQPFATRSLGASTQQVDYGRALSSSRPEEGQRDLSERAEMPSIFNVQTSALKQADSYKSFNAMPRYAITASEGSMPRFQLRADIAGTLDAMIPAGEMEASTAAGPDQIAASSQSSKPSQHMDPSTRLSRSTRPCLIVSEGSDLQIGDRRLLPYKVIQSLGMGGCALVEMVQDITTGRLFAHKLFRRYHGPNLDKFKQDIRNEVMIMRRLSSHPHIIRLFATYSCNRDFGMILSPVADSGDLATYLLRIRDSGKPPTAEDVAVLACAFGCLASGLAYIHQQTIRHKDIKPGNILVHQGRVIYTDFGIAFDGKYLENTTTTGRPNGFTRRYCAPEVAEWTKRNRKSDIFSLGCVFIEVLTVLEPFFYMEYLAVSTYHEIVRKLQTDLKQKCTHNSHWNSLVRICIDMLEPDINQRINTSDLLTKLHALKPLEFIPPIGYFCTSCSKDI